MPEKTLRYQKTNQSLVIYVNSPYSSPMWKTRTSAELNGLCDEIAWDEEIRVIILTGSEEKSFFAETSPIIPFPELGDETWANLSSLSEPISKLDKPIIAAINGDAIGQGLELALACDVRIAAKTSRFGLPQIKTGLIPWDGGTQRLARLVGRGKALEMILTGETIDAQEAYRVGLIHRVVPLKELMEAAMNMAWEMASKGPIALRYAKEAIYKGMDLTLEQGLRLEADLYLLIHTTRDRTEGIKAFQEKKSPQFEGK
jgi:enoyl-CoA hydratase/carnithine racemase